MLSLRFLGSGDAFGSGGRFQACILLDAGGRRVLLDCGATSLSALTRWGVDPATIEAVVISHLHGDHFGGLPFLLLDAQFSRREAPLLIAGPPGTEQRTREAMEVFFPGSSATRQRFEVRYVEMQTGVPVAAGPARVTAFAAEHASGAPSHALRVEAAGRVIGYSGDTAWTDELVRVADGADVFICEAYYADKRVPFHLDYATLRANRERLACRRLVLTHMSADMLATAPEAGAIAAYDGLLLTL